MLTVVDYVDGAAALEERRGPPARRGNPWGPWMGDKVKRIGRPDVPRDDDKVKRSAQTTEGNPSGPWTDDENHDHKPHNEGNPWGPWTGDKE